MLADHREATREALTDLTPPNLYQSQIEAKGPLDSCVAANEEGMNGGHSKLAILFNLSFVMSITFYSISLL